MPDPTIRAVAPSDRPRVRAFLLERWGSEQVAVHGVLYEPAELDGFLAEDPRSGELLGLLTYRAEADTCEIVTLDAGRERQGIGTALVEAVAALGHARLWLVTTNDNLHALRWYVGRGFRVVAVHEGAVDRAREALKPEIPLAAPDGTPIRDEIELELRRTPGR